MPSHASRILLYILVAAYAVLGAILFVTPHASSTHFAWKVSPFVTMTIGGWCLGNAWLAWVIARRERWAGVFGATLYLGLFGWLQTGIAIAYRDRLLLANPLAWLYLFALVATCIFAVLALIDWWRQWPVLFAFGRRMRWLESLEVVAFILLVGFLGLYGLTAVEGSRGLNATIFPEKMSMLTLRSFGAFYFALALAPIPLLRARGLGNLLSHGYAFYGLIVFITAAAVAFIGLFDFAAQPKQALYIGAYLLVGIPVGLYLVRYGVGHDDSAVSDPPRRIENTESVAG